MKSASSLSLNSNTSSNSTVDTEVFDPPNTIYECIRLAYSRNGSKILGSRNYNDFEIDDIFQVIKKTNKQDYFSKTV